MATHLYLVGPPLVSATWFNEAARHGASVPPQILTEEEEETSVFAPG